MMHSYSDTMCLLLVLLLRLVLVQMLYLPADERPKAMRIMEVLPKSVCRPIEKIVNVDEEFPECVEYIYRPSCVPLFRCSGCCNDEAQECYPTAERNITLELFRSNQLVNLTFVEHQACGARMKHKDQNEKQGQLKKGGSLGGQAEAVTSKTDAPPFRC